MCVNVVPDIEEMVVDQVNNGDRPLPLCQVVYYPLRAQHYNELNK